MYVCLCFGLSDKQIRSMLREGASLADIQARCKAGSNCGRCLQSLSELEQAELGAQIQDLIISDR